MWNWQTFEINDPALADAGLWSATLAIGAEECRALADSINALHPRTIEVGSDHKMAPQMPLARWIKVYGDLRPDVTSFIHNLLQLVSNMRAPAERMSFDVDENGWRLDARWPQA